MYTIIATIPKQIWNMMTTNIASSSSSVPQSIAQSVTTTACGRRSVIPVYAVVVVVALIFPLLVVPVLSFSGMYGNHHTVAVVRMGNTSDYNSLSDDISQDVASTTTYFELVVPPKSYKVGDIVELKVNTLTSTKDLYPMDYYHLPYCVPEGGIRLQQQNLGEYLSGDRIQNSPYLLKMKTDMYCEQLCTSFIGRTEQPYTTLSRFVQAIRSNYHNNWIVDNLPSASKVENGESLRMRYWQGFPVGFINEADQKAYVYNHVNIVIEYHADETMKDAYRIVRFMVQPFSIAHEIRELVKNPDEFDWRSANHSTIKAKMKSPIPSCYPRMTSLEHTSYDMLVDNSVKPQLASGEVLFTYDVIWKENPKLQWASRWDIYMSMNSDVPTEVHRMSILKSIIIIVTMSALGASKWIAILRRTPVADSDDYKLIQCKDVTEAGWMAVRSDVFRPPLFSPMLLAVGCGSGAQLLCTTIVTVGLAYLGFLKSPNRGYLILCQWWSYSIFGFINGYVTARYYKAFDGKEYHRTTAVAAFGLPGIALTFFVVVECIAILKQSSHALPLTAILTLFALWASTSVPLVFLGARWGYDQDAIEYPVATSSTPREIPKHPLFRYQNSPTTAGMIPLSLCSVELYYIMSSIWMDCYYDEYGYLLFVVLLELIVNVEQAIYLTYCQLNSEDYHWWWRAYWNGGSVGIYIFLYSFLYFPNLEVTSLASYVLYYGFMGLVSLAIFAMMGFVGVSSSLYFNKVLYTSIKTE